MEWTPAHPPRQEAQKRGSLGRKLHDASITNRNPSWLAEFKKQLIYLGDPSYLQTVTLLTKKVDFFFWVHQEIRLKNPTMNEDLQEIRQIISPLGIPDSNRLENRPVALGLQTLVDSMRFPRQIPSFWVSLWSVHQIIQGPAKSIFSGPCSMDAGA